MWFCDRIAATSMQSSVINAQDHSVAQTLSTGYCALLMKVAPLKDKLIMFDCITNKHMLSKGLKDELAVRWTQWGAHFYGVSRTWCGFKTKKKMHFIKPIYGNCP